MSYSKADVAVKRVCFMTFEVGKNASETFQNMSPETQTKYASETMAVIGIVVCKGELIGADNTYDAILAKAKVDTSENSAKKQSVTLCSEASVAWSFTSNVASAWVADIRSGSLATGESRFGNCRLWSILAHLRSAVGHTLSMTRRFGNI